uniref:Uncharacterized protein n=1 Tax=Steinernema glaseri TaxID=37863 RepID=A0A1I7ZYE7_9BILA
MTCSQLIFAPGQVCRAGREEGRETGLLHTFSKTSVMILCTLTIKEGSWRHVKECDEVLLDGKDANTIVIMWMLTDHALSFWWMTHCRQSQLSIRVFPRSTDLWQMQPCAS